jgi:hypothetical protein
MHRRSYIRLSALGLLLAACAPSLDWRQVSLGAGLTVLMPCKPERVERRVTVEGVPGEGVMLSCEAGGFSWSTTTLRFAGEAQAAAAQRPVAQALASNLGAASPAAEASKGLAGSEPWHVEGRRPDGRPVRAWMKLSRDGGVLIQQVILAADAGVPPAEAQETFLSGPERRARP